MEIREIENKDAWEEFLTTCQEKTFLQSWHWGEFQKMLGNKIWRLGIYESSKFKVQSSKLIGLALAVKIEARRGRFLFVPHGPVLRTGNPKSKIQNLYPPKFLKKTWAGEQIPNSKFQILNILIIKLKEIAKKEKCSFIRIAPIWPARCSFSEGVERSEEAEKIFRDLGFRDAPIHIHPELTWQLDIKPPEQELLKQMRKTTRYLVRQAQKQGVEVFQSQNIEDLKRFNQLYQGVAHRHRFTPFSLDYLRKEFLAFLADNEVSLFFAKYKGEIIASAVIVFWQGIGFYHHGASSLKYAKIPASYLLQWEVIKEAKKRGCWLYNFWGIADIKSKIKNQKSKTQIKNQKLEKAGHPWAGLTLFKMGFGGYERAYLKTQDLPLANRYWLNYFIEKIRRLKRGL